MPLPRYKIYPTYISQVHMPDKIDNELEYVSNETLCNLMHQMASVANAASEIFDELTSDLVSITNRLNRIEARVSSVSSTLKALPTSEEFLSLGLQDLPTITPGSREQELDSQVLHRSTKPRCMQAQYEAAEAPPPLHMMDALRDDGKTTARLYSDPRFFFDLWRKEMLEDAFDGTNSALSIGAKDGKKVTKKKRPKPKSKPSTSGTGDYPPHQQLQPQQQFMPQPQVLQAEIQRTQAQASMTVPQLAANDGGTPTTGGGSEYGDPEETLNHPSEWMAGAASHPTPPFPYHHGGSDGGLMTTSCDSPPPPPPPPSLMDLSISSIGGTGGSGCGALSVEPIHSLPPYAPSLSPQLDGSGDALNSELPPPPPPPTAMNIGSDNILSTSFHTEQPPPPPSPPPPPPPPPLPAAPVSLTGQISSTSTAKLHFPCPPRDLLSDIRAGGFRLRKVSERQLPPKIQPKESASSRICDVSEDRRPKNRRVHASSTSPAQDQSSGWAIFEMVSKRRQCLENTSEDDDDKTSDSCGWED